jgi:hypothetical protein
MPQKISIIPLCAILVVIIALFATVPARAQGEETCPPTTGQAGPYTIKLVDGSPTPSGDGWVWEYEITANRAYKINKIREVLLTYPDCCGEDINILEPIDPNIYLPCKSALPIRRWPMVCDDFTLKLPFTHQNKQDRKISITTDTNNIGINTVGIRTYWKFYVAAIAGPACAGVLIPVENEPVSTEKVFRSVSPAGVVLEWKLLFDSAGNSFDAACITEEPYCLVSTVPLNEIEFSGGILNSLPVDDPLVTGENPRCVYVRTRSGGVKKIGDCP